MSKENVEIVRAHLDAYLRGDNDTALAAYDLEVVFDVSVRPEGKPYYGREGVAEALRVWTGTWEDWSLVVEQVIDAGDKVLTIVRESGRAREAGSRSSSGSLVCSPCARARSSIGKVSSPRPRPSKPPG